jgi:transposase, IS5 family
MLASATTVERILDSPEVASLIRNIEGARWTGRKGYAVRALVGACLVKALYAIPTWSKTASLIAEHEALREALCGSPSVYALYRFKDKLMNERETQLYECINCVLASLKEQHPGFGTNIAIDASDIPAYANGQRFVSKNGPERKRFSDPDASWGHRSAVSTRKGGGFYGYRLHMAVDTGTELPVGWFVATAKLNETPAVPRLIYEMEQHEIKPSTAAMDLAYDNDTIYNAFDEIGCVPVVPLKEVGFVKKGKHLSEKFCKHGWLTFAGADYKNKRTKWRCPTGECKIKNTWIKGSRYHPLIPHETARWKKLRCGRASVEREFGRLKHQYGLTPLRVRGIERVRLHADLTILGVLAAALDSARQKAKAPPLPLAA